jgi:ATP-dependent DNA helicase RecG
VGRGQHTSYCLLILDTNDPEAMERVKEIEETSDPARRAKLEGKLPEALVRLRALESINDGFKLAEIDWTLRGAGDLIGTRQSGGETLKLAAFITPELAALAQREARTIYEEDPDLSQDQHRLLAQRVQIMKDERSDVS